jgi:fatty-acyl-CoA synthase
MFIAELDHPRIRRFDLSSLRTGIMAGAPCPIEVMRRVNEQMHMREVTIAYGMTETSPVSFQSATDDPLERRVSTVGRIHPHVEVKIVDLEGRIVPRGERGELCTRGYSVMLGYWDEEERPPSARRRRLDAHRRSRHHRRRGLLQHRRPHQGHGDPRRREPLSARDRGIPLHPSERSRTCRCSASPTRSTARSSAPGSSCARRDADRRRDPRFCQGQIAHNKIPRYVEFVDEFPMTVTGKIQKFVMRPPWPPAALAGHAGARLCLLRARLPL